MPSLKVKYYHSTDGVGGADVHSNWRIVQSCLAPEIQIRTAPDFAWITTFAQKCGTGYQYPLLGFVLEELLGCE